MNAVRLRRRIDSETLHLPELRPFVGKDVEIIVLEDGTDEPDLEDALRTALSGSILRDDDPYTPVAEDDWEALQ